IPVFLFRAIERASDHVIRNRVMVSKKQCAGSLLDAMVFQWQERLAGPNVNEQPIESQLGELIQQRAIIRDAPGNRAHRMLVEHAPLSNSQGRFFDDIPLWEVKLAAGRQDVAMEQVA